MRDVLYADRRFFSFLRVDDHIHRGQLIHANAVLDSLGNKAAVPGEFKRVLWLLIDAFFPVRFNFEVSQNLSTLDVPNVVPSRVHSAGLYISDKVALARGDLSKADVSEFDKHYALEL